MTKLPWYEKYRKDDPEWVDSVIKAEGNAVLEQLELDTRYPLSNFYCYTGRSGVRKAGDK